MTEAAKLFEQAIDPKQYDISPMWSINRQGKEARARELHYSSFLYPFKDKWNGGTFLDIGAGTGWLVAEASHGGTQRAIGIDPSKTNLLTARYRFPGITMVEATLEAYQTTESFNNIAAIMSLCHIGNLEEAFRKLLALSDPGATIYTVVPDPDHFLQNRYGDQEVTVQKLDNGVWVTKTETPTGPRAEIVRDPNLYTLTAVREGFVLIAEVPMPPTKILVRAVPRYAQVNGPMTHLQVYQTSVLPSANQAQ